jgi:signal transduction histidine kinase
MSAARSFKFRLIWATVLVLVGVLALASVFAFLAFRHPAYFIHSHIVLFGGCAFVFVMGGLWQIRKGLSQFNQMRGRLHEVREGRTNRIEGSYPSEVQPLVDDLNALLGHRERIVERAQAKAGDLAHGLKTPLAVLIREADNVRATGQNELAATITEQVDRMQRQIHYHLAQASAAASGAALGVRTSIAESAEGLLRTLRKLYAERGLTMESLVAPNHILQAQREDLDEMLGNLLDNACKWAKTRVTISSAVEDDQLSITIDDDGPGIDPSMRASVLERGVRADEAAPGTGLGLAIVRDLAAVYSGTLALEDSPIGGLRARLRLPKSPGF